MMIKGLVLISLALALTLTACATQGVSVTFHRSGGGEVMMDDTWQITADGKVAHQSKSPHTPEVLTTEQMTELTEAIRAVNFMSLADSYVPEDTCCDRLLYEITVVLNGQSKMVSTITLSPNAPAELTRLVDTLNQMVSSAK